MGGGGGLGGCYGVWEEERGGHAGHKGERVCLCLCRSPRGDCGIVEVNESDWLVGVFLLVLRFAQSQGFTFFFISPSLASAQRGMKDRMADKKCAKFLLKVWNGLELRFNDVEALN